MWRAFDKSHLLNQAGTGVDPVFDLIDIWFLERKSWWPSVVDWFRSSGSVNFVEKNDADCYLEIFCVTGDLGSVKGHSIEDEEDQDQLPWGLFSNVRPPICLGRCSVSDPSRGRPVWGEPRWCWFISMTSRVVPSISVTMAFSAQKAVRLDYRTFVDWW